MYSKMRFNWLVNRWISSSLNFSRARSATCSTSSLVIFIQAPRKHPVCQNANTLGCLFQGKRIGGPRFLLAKTWKTLLERVGHQRGCSPASAFCLAPVGHAFLKALSISSIFPDGTNRNDFNLDRGEKASLYSYSIVEDFVNRYPMDERGKRSHAFHGTRRAIPDRAEPMEFLRRYPWFMDPFPGRS